MGPTWSGKKYGYLEWEIPGILWEQHRNIMGICRNLITTSLADHHSDGECTAEPRTNFSGLTYELVAKMGLPSGKLT